GRSDAITYRSRLPCHVLLRSLSFQQRGTRPSTRDQVSPCFVCPPFRRKSHYLVRGSKWPAPPDLRAAPHALTDPKKSSMPTTRIRYLAKIAFIIAVLCADKLQAAATSSASAKLWNAYQKAEVFQKNGDFMQ